MGEKMLTWTMALAVAVLAEGYQDSICPQREPSPGVLVLTPGREVVLYCHGDVIVDSILKVKGKAGGHFITTRQEATKTTSDGVHNGQPTEATFTKAEGTTTGNGPKEAGMTSDDKRRGTTPGMIKTETERASSPDGKSGGNLSDRYQESTQGTPPSSPGQRVAERDAFENQPRTVTESTLFATQQSDSSATERPEVVTPHGVSTVPQPSPKTDGDAVTVGTAGLQRRIFWTRNGVMLPGSAEKSVLSLLHLRPWDAGNYSCYSQGALMSNVKITLGSPPVNPTLSCYRKSHESKIRCDWTSPQPVVPTPKCNLLLRKSGHSSTVACSYSVTRSRCWCVFDHEEQGGWGPRNVYIARLCVTNTAGNATSPEVRFTAENSIKPDPPVSVRASGLQGGERLLVVSWSYPLSWRRGFYQLRFQLRYRPAHADKYQTVETEGLSWTITDAWPDAEYELQLRAIEEFSLGHWSDWTSAVHARAWKPPESTTVADFHSLDPLWYVDEGSGSGEEIRIPDSVVSDDSMDIFGTAFGVCVLVVMLILLSAYVFRHRVRFASKLGKLGASPPPGDSSVSPPPPSPEEEKPLMSPVSPTPSQATMQHHFPLPPEGNTQSIHFHNRGYFLVPKDN
ncbi:interleukin-6 receptor subunit alpha [Engraulis encrasicolus]|uniref:interleukin-6 receptor subunit alpha n=1 Tax=Engraulis encrasicolus TaxID=184585 RepID=UPI002FD56629